MNKLLTSEKGSVVSFVAAVVVILVSLISSVSLIGIVEKDHLHTYYQQDMIQQELLLRTEAYRTSISIEVNPNRPLPERSVEIIDPEKVTTYTIKNTSRPETISNFMGYATEQVVAVNSRITGKRARKNTSADKLPIVRETERYLRNQSLAQYQYFSDTEASENEDSGVIADVAVKFWGPDVFYGKVHSNDDIWIQQAGGGNNGGWPTFYDYVTTAGEFKYYPSGINLAESGAPMDDIFQGSPEPGWEEGVPPIIFEPDATDIQLNGVRPFNPEYEIIYVKLNGNSWDAMQGDIVLEEIKSFPVLSWFPHNADLANAAIAADLNWYLDADTVWTNQIAIYDTVWAPLSGSNINGSIYAESQLWIEGVVAGKQTWASSDTIFITDDITYATTDIGSAPDDIDNPNQNDYFGLVSEKSILIKYKHRDPFLEDVIRDGNCTDVYMYGAYAAIGEGDVALYGDMACHYDGLFTFEYQHPHGSTPHFTAQSPFTLEDTLYKYVDFHKYIYPKNPFAPPDINDFNLHGAAPPDGFVCGYDYESAGYVNSYPNTGPPYAIPYGTDWPWYNPVWPEDRNDIVWERGEIHLYGAIAQRRRGFVHRSGSDDYNHPPSTPGLWDLDHYRYDGDHPATGYDKDYHYDQRFLFVQPPDYPQIYQGWGENTLTSFETEAWFFKVPSDD